MNKTGVGTVAGVGWEFPALRADGGGSVAGGEGDSAGGGGGSVPVVEVAVGGGVGGVCKGVDMGRIWCSGPVGIAGGLYSRSVNSIRITICWDVGVCWEESDSLSAGTVGGGAETEVLRHPAVAVGLLGDGVFVHVASVFEGEGLGSSHIAAIGGGELLHVG